MRASPIKMEEKTEETRILISNITSYNTVSNYTSRHHLFSHTNTSSINNFIHYQVGPGEVDVYIWYSNNFFSIGHIAVAFNKGKGEEYVSFWPDGESKEIANIKGKWSDRTTDCRMEAIGTGMDNRAPDYCIKLYNLDIEKMDEQYINIKKTIETWSLIASTPLNFKPEQQSNCIAVAISLLKAGGIEDFTKEELVKTKANKSDKPMLFLPYRQNKLDKALKVSCDACKICIICLMLSLYTMVLFYLCIKVYASLDTKDSKQLNTKLKRWKQIPAFEIFNRIMVGLSIFFPTASCILCCLKGSIRAAREIDAVFSTGETVSTLTRGSLEVPYDLIRGLYDNTYTPSDHRIKDILEKAAKIGLNYKNGVNANWCPQIL